MLTDEEVYRLAEEISPVKCLVTQGIVIMRPLVIHGSSKATSEQPRRVILNTLRRGRLRKDSELTVASRQKQISRCARDGHAQALNELQAGGYSAEVQAPQGLKPGKN